MQDLREFEVDSTPGHFGKTKQVSESLLGNSYVNLKLERCDWIESHSSHCVIDDLTCRIRDLRVAKAVQVFQASCTGAVKVYSATALTARLEIMMKGLADSCDPDHTLLIFPGEGAQAVKASLSRQFRKRFRSISVIARRVRDPKTGRVRSIDLPWSEQCLRKLVTRENIRILIVLDDVIDTGATLEALKKKVSRKNIAWYAGAPLIVSRLHCAEEATYKTRLERYEQVFATVMLEARNSLVSLNSLSSFLEGGEKTNRLVAKFLNQYVGSFNRTRFIEAIQTLGVLLGYYDCREHSWNPEPIRSAYSKRRLN